jgi:opacity protein-like surface antigen
MKAVKTTLMVALFFGLFQEVPLAEESSGITATGVKFGTNIANFRGEDTDELDPRIGFVGGPFLNYSFNSTFSVQPELLFSMKGAGFEEGDSSGTLQLNYLEIPILGKASFPLADRISPNLFVWPSFGFNVNADVEATRAGETEEEDIGEFINDTEIGFIFGGGLDFKLNNGNKVLLDIRYNMGLTDVFDFDELDLDEDVSFQNEVISTMIGYAF